MVRLKTRYLLFEVLYPNELQLEDLSDKEKTAVALRQPSKVDAKAITKLLRYSIEKYFGEYGLGVVASTIAVKYFNPTTSKGIIRVSRPHFRLVWAALSYIDKIEGRDCIITVSRVSGTIKKVEQRAIAKNRESLNSLERLFDAEPIEED